MSDANLKCSIRIRLCRFLSLIARSALRRRCTYWPSQTRDEVVALMRPYAGSSAAGVDRTTLTGKVMCGYQGWFTAEGDGGRGLASLPEARPVSAGHAATSTCGPT